MPTMMLVVPVIFVVVVVVVVFVVVAVGVSSSTRTMVTMPVRIPSFTVAFAHLGMQVGVSQANEACGRRQMCAEGR